LTDNGLSIFGALPNGLSGTIQTSIANQVNLVVAGAPTVDIAYWDGPNTTPGNVEGGRGGTYVWNSPTNWTTAPGNANSVWDSGIGVFGGVTGTVTVENTQAFVGLQFVTDDYLLQTGAGGALNLGSGGFIHVDTGLVNTTMQVGIEGTGALLKQGDGRLVLTGTNTHAGGTAITAGTLAVGSNAALGTGTGSIADGATLQAAAGSLTVGNAVTVAGISTIDTQAHDFTLSGQISGAGTAHKTGTGTLNLSATGSAIGGLDIAAGGLTNAGTVGVSGGAVMGTDTVLTNRAGAELTAAGNVTGDAGAQAIDNAGTLEAAIDLGGGDDRYHLRTSGTQAGDADGGAGLDALALNAGPLARTIAEGDFVNFETVTLNGDAGASGRIVLSGATAPATQATLDAGSSGLASLQAGELNLATSASSLRTGILTTAAGTALSGNGTIFGNLAMAGFISPGNSIGTLTVDGDYVQVGAYDVEISHLAGAAPGLSLSDQIVTSGAVSFGGTVAVSIDAGSSLAEIMAAGRSKGAMRWRILDGTTAIAAGQRTAALQVPAGLAAALDYANGGQDVDLFMAWAAPPEVVQQAGLVWQVALRPDRALCDESTSGTPQRSCAFVQGGALRIDDDRPGGSDANDWSGMAGGGAQVRPDLWLGLAAGYREGELGGADYDRVAGHVWGAWTPGAADLRGFAGIGYYDVEGNRATTSGGTASWDYGAWQPFVAAEARYWVDVTRTLAVTPLAGLTSVWLNLPRHGETGAGIENFNVDAQTLWGMTALLGAEARWRVTPQLTLEASAGWQHLFGDDAVRITGGYAGSPGVELSGRSAAVDRDSLALGLAMLMPLDSNAMLRLDYDAEVNAGQFVQSGFARLTMGW
jgi:autotransporter-associated beta strand protein